nr:hypothetical 10.0 kDa protein y4MD [Bradyrhizobium sp. DOA9]
MCRSETAPESILQCLPVGDEVTQPGWRLSLRQSSNQRPRGVHQEDAAIKPVLLLGHGG